MYLKHDNSFEYWFAKRFEYFCVAKMAIDVLLIPAMAVKCERTIFSAGSMVLPRRYWLDVSIIAVT
jgi:hypothetical protein